MARNPHLPLLPGLTFNPNIGRTKFNIDPKFGFNAGIPCLIEKVRPNMMGPLSDRYPSVYARGEVIEIPSWIAFDKQILTFDGFFKQNLEEVRNSPYAVRNVKLFFFLEDGTMQITERTQDNSGFMPGTLLSRQRVRLPAPMDDNFYNILDFNIGREVEIYGKFIKLTDCDKFTRNFLNRQGISVPDPINTPSDPFLEDRAQRTACILPKKPKKGHDTFGKFLKNDRKLLRFYGYWDDREREFGEFHDLEVFYYRADDTIEIKDIVPTNAGRDTGSLLIKRCKLPKKYKGLPEPGLDQQLTVLNVLGASVGSGRYVTDPLDAGKEHVDYYTDRDLSIGGVLNVFGRNVILTDADAKTKEYYRNTYGITNFVPIRKPTDEVEDKTKLKKKVKDRELPPWNGFGSYEDSAQNCVTVEMVAPLKDFKKFLQYDRKGMDSQILRYRARMISRNQHLCERNFVICYYQSDDTISVLEIPCGGGKASTFFTRCEVFLPGQEIYTSDKPRIYQPQHLFIGAQIIINSFYFVLVDADEYALRYMELHCQHFPKSDINLIMNKLREKLKPIYKDFVADMLPDTPAITYEQLRNKLCPIMGPEFTEHEMITIARRFSLTCQKERLNRDAIRAITLTILKRELWDDLARLREYFMLRDSQKTGLLPRQSVYTLLRGCRFPVDVQLLEKILDVIDKDEKGNICYLRLFEFLDRNKCPMTDTIPINVKSELWWAGIREPQAGGIIDWCDFNKELNLEYIFTERPKPTGLVVPKED